VNQKTKIQSEIQFGSHGAYAPFTKKHILNFKWKKIKNK
jgi:hypothetical protein